VTGEHMEFPLRVSGAVGLRSLVDKNLYPPSALEVTQEMITKFGELTHDRQWIHLDAAAAVRQSPFGKTIAQGFLTLSLVTYFVTSAVRVEGVRLALGCGINRARFLNPVAAGTELKARIKLKQVQELEGCVEAVWSVALVRDGRLAPLCIADWIVRYYL